MSKAAEMKRKNDLGALEAAIKKSFGAEAAAIGGLQKALKTIPTGSLALDYELGIGGWPLGKLVGVFGPRDIGKSSMVGLNAVRNAQAMGFNCVWIALEPFSEEWARKNGVDTDKLLVMYPTTGEEAFAMALKAIGWDGEVQLVVFDSIGAVLSEGEMDDDGKPRMGGQAGLITWFVKAAAPLAYRNDCCVILLNQIRDVMSRIPGLTHQPGGNALEHHEAIIVQLKRNSGAKETNQYSIKKDGTDVIVGQKIVAHILRNKEAEGTGKKAVFDYFFMETDEYPFGIDEFSDIINTARRTGVITLSGSYFTLPNGKKLQGMAAVAEYLQGNPAELLEVREGVLAAMLNRNARTTLEGAEDDARIVSDGAS